MMVDKMAFKAYVELDLEWCHRMTQLPDGINWKADWYWGGSHRNAQYQNINDTTQRIRYVYSQWWGEMPTNAETIYSWIEQKTDELIRKENSLYPLSMYRHPDSLTQTCLRMNLRHSITGLVRLRCYLDDFLQGKPHESYESLKRASE
jgi:hypothetical protein